MDWFLCLVFTAFLILSFFWGYRKTKKESKDNFFYQTGFCLAGPGFITTAFIVFYKIRYSVFDEHNWLRLQRTFLWSLGYPLYPPPDTNPIMVSLYGPISALAYWPATWAPSYTMTVPMASACAAFFMLAPAAWLLFSKSSPHRLAASLLFFCFVLSCALLTSLKYAAFNVHADAPALGLSAVAAGFIYQSSRSRKRLFLSAFFVILAVAAKQTSVPLAAALPLYVGLRDGRKNFLIYCGVLAVAACLLGGLFVWMFGLDNLIYHMWTIPEGHPFRANNFLSLMKIFSRLIRETLLIAAVSLPALIFAIKQKASWREKFHSNRWIIFWVVAFLMTPMALLANIKMGGSSNTLSFVTYFFLLGSALALKDLFFTAEKNLGRPALLFYTSVLLLVSVPFVYVRILSLKNQRDFAKAAYLYIKTHPGTTYFPRLTLLHLLAEKKAYHDVDGIMDRHWSNLPISDEHIQAYLPKDLRLIAFSGEDHRAVLPLKHFPVVYSDYPPLPGYKVYTRDGLPPEEHNL